MAYNSAAVEQDLNWIRLRIGDTDANDQQLTDAEITTLLNTEGSKHRAAAAAANAIAATYTRFGAQNEAEAFTALAMLIRTEEPPAYL